MIDPRIPLMGQGVDIADIMAKSQQYRANQEQLDGKRRLGDLLPQAAGGDRDAINEIAGIDPRLFMQMDERQREQTKAGLADLGAAVRWADTPEKWAQVQQHYGQKGVDLSPYGFDKREQGMMMLGQLGQYLESAPKAEIRATEPGGGLYSIQGDQVRVLVQPNDGSQPMGAPAQSGPQPGQVEDGYRFKGGNPADPNSWEPVNGGQTPQASGGFPPAGY